MVSSSRPLVHTVTLRLLNRSAKYPPGSEKTTKGIANTIGTTSTNRKSRCSRETPDSSTRKLTSHLSALSLNAPWNCVAMSAQKPSKRPRGSAAVASAVAGAGWVGSMESGGELLQGFVDKALGAHVRTLWPLPLHREITAIVGGFHDIEGELHADAVDLAGVADFRVLHMADVVGVGEHGLHRIVVERGIIGGHGVAKIG